MEVLQAVHDQGALLGPSTVSLAGVRTGFLLPPFGPITASQVCGMEGRAPVGSEVS